MIAIFLLLLLATISGCDSESQNNELANKTDYSLLQSYEYKYREVANDQDFIISQKTREKDATVIGFPRKDKAQGYVMVIANSRYDPKVKYMPEVDFTVTKATIEDVKSQINLSKEVESFLYSQAAYDSKIK